MTIMLTVRQLLRGEGKYWTTKPSQELSSIETLAWSAAEELASFADLLVEPEDLPEVGEKAWLALWGLEAYFKERGCLLSQSHALEMLMIERVGRGLTARGDDTEPPAKP